VPSGDKVLTGMDKRWEGFEERLRATPSLPDQLRAKRGSGNLRDLGFTDDEITGLPDEIKDLPEEPTAPKTPKVPGVVARLRQAQSDPELADRTATYQDNSRKFITESAPSTIGMGLGAAVGGLAGPVGVIAGGSAGAAAGEWLGQKAGIVPESPAMVGVSAAGPLVGPVGRYALGKLPMQAIGKTLSMMHPIKKAIGVMRSREAAEGATKMVDGLLSRQTGLMAKPHKALYAARDAAAGPISLRELPNTVATLNALTKEAARYKNLPNGAALYKELKDIMKFMRRSDLSLGDIGELSSAVGAATSKFTARRLGAERKLFHSVVNDLDGVAKRLGSNQKAAQLHQAATKRYALEKGGEQFKEAIDRAITQTEYGANIDIGQVAKWFNREMSSAGNPAFARAFKPYAAEIRRSLNEWQKVIAVTTGGAAMLQISARSAALGAMIGGIVGSGPGAFVGGLVGASSPGMLTQILAHPRASKFLTKAIEMGHGTVSWKTYQAIGHIATQNRREATMEKEAREKRLQKEVGNDPR
jgi:hypothetical protein